MLRNGEGTGKNQAIDRDLSAFNLRHQKNLGKVRNMNSTDKSSDYELAWPVTPTGILIMGKRQGTKKENLQLWGRTALAAALWYSAPQPKPYLIFVAADIHGPDNIPDGLAVKKLLTQTYGISADFVILRPVSNCTLIEVRAVRVLTKFYGLSQIFAVTHLYHAPRAQRYLDEIVPNAAVIPVHPDILETINFPAEYKIQWETIEKAVQDSMPGKLDALREHLIESVLNIAHTIDRRGKFERWLARRLRPTAYPKVSRSR